MARTNFKPAPIFTNEGARAKRINAEQQLRRSVMSCLLWEKQFYEEGEDIADRIAKIIPLVEAHKVAEIAVEAREKMNLRHAPLFIVREMARVDTHKHLVASTLERVIQRADELAEFCALYWKDGRQPLSSQVKKGLAMAFGKFGEYSLAKYNRDGTVKLRDVLFLSHAKPKDKEQAALWKKLVDGELAAPDTWEVALSSGENKTAAWTRLLKEKKLGGLALLRNLRNMHNASVDDSLIKESVSGMRTDRILPFRFIASANHAPQFEPEIESAMLRCLTVAEKLQGKTVLLVDVSGSMDSPLSGRSELSRMDAACGLAMLLREVCENVEVYSFSMALKHIPARHGFALRDAINHSQPHSGTPLGEAVKCVYADRGYKVASASFGWYGRHALDYQGQELRPDRLIVITDEQSATSVPDPIGKGYMINVASAQNGIGYGPWTHIDGWSEAVLNYISVFEENGE